MSLAACSGANTTRFEQPFFQDPVVTGSVTPRVDVGAYRTADAGSPTSGSAAQSSAQPYPAVASSQPGYSSRPGASPQAVESGPLAPPAGQVQTAAYQPATGPAQYQPPVAAQAQPAVYQPQSTAKAAPGGRYIVQPGDTAYSIAQRHGVTTGSLLSANGIADPTGLRIGQQLVIPGGSQPVVQAAAPAPATAPATNNTRYQFTAPTAGSGNVHVVSSGETLYSISRRHGVTPSQIASANGISDPSNIRIGQKLAIPGAGSAVTAPAQPAVQTAALTQPGATTDAGPQGYTPPPVQKAVVAPVQQPQTESPAPQKAALPSPTGMSSAKFRWPAEGRIISSFGSKNNGAHNDGINISVPEGTPIRAAENGVVAYAGNELKGFGNLVLIRHSDDWVTAYAHASELNVKRGDQISRGQVIAKAGKTGAVNAPQLHFEVRKGSRPVDPMDHLTKS